MIDVDFSTFICNLYL